MFSSTYIIISIVVLAVIAILVFLAKRNTGKRLSPLAGLAFAFTVAGIVFGTNILIGYGLIGVGVILAVIDIVQSWKNKQKKL